MDDTTKCPECGTVISNVEYIRYGGVCCDCWHKHNMKRTRRKKYYDTKKEAETACSNMGDPSMRVWKMPKGTRHAGKYAVCSELEYLNTY